MEIYFFFLITYVRILALRRPKKKTRAVHFHAKMTAIILIFCEPL